MATDYDAPRKTEEDLREESLEELKARRADKAATLPGMRLEYLEETQELK